MAAELRALADLLDGKALPQCENRCGGLDWAEREFYAELGTCPCQQDVR